MESQKRPDMVAYSPGIAHYMKEGNLLEADLSSFVKVEGSFSLLVSHMEAKSREAFCF